MDHESIMGLCAVIQQELQSPDVNIAKVSIALGSMESPLTKKDPTERCWPVDFLGEVRECLDIFQHFVAEVNRQLATKKLDTRGKVKLVADAVWSKLTGVFVNDVLHVQHVYVFTQHLKYGTKSSKRQLDCGGVVTTVLAACQLLALQHGHTDLAACRFQVSEDHCWLNCDPEAERKGTVEVTTDSAAKRALPVDTAAWQGWLYSGGHAPLCSHQMTITAMITSMNPCITARQTGEDSEQVQRAQRHLLRMIHSDYPHLMYPAALGCLADLEEIQMQDALEAAVKGDDKGQLEQHLQDAQILFEQAIQTSMQPGLGGHHQWYPYSYMFGHLMRRAEFLVKEAAQLLGQDVALQQADTAIQSAMLSIGSRGGAVVLQQYRFMSTDEQLYKDIEGVLEQSCDMFKWRHQQAKQPITQTDQLTNLLEFWDGICHLYTGKAKPSHWVGHLLRTLKLFTSEARIHAAGTARISSAVMTNVSSLLAELKAPRIKGLFETADIADANGNSSKRQKRSGTHRLDG